MANINWFPGHMAKTLRELKEQIGSCDCILELLDARIPQSSRNPMLDSLAQNKPRLIVLSRNDLAHPDITRQWCKVFTTPTQVVLAGNLQTKQDIALISKQLKSMNEQRSARAKLKGRVSIPLRVLVAGVPNVGKSTLINGLLGRKSQQVSNRPGVTRSLNWLRAKGDFLLLDSPGVLWPKLDTYDISVALAVTGAIRDDILPLEDIALWLIQRLEIVAPNALAERYGSWHIENFHEQDDTMMVNPEISRAYGILTQLALNNHCIKAKGEADTLVMSKKIINDFRSLRLGQITLELPQG